MRFHFEPPSLEFPLVNSSAETIEADVRLELLDPVGKSAVVGDCGCAGGSGQPCYLRAVERSPSAHGFAPPNFTGIGFLIESRRVAAPPPVAGLVQLARIAQGLFRVRIYGLQSAHQGAGF